MKYEYPVIKDGQFYEVGQEVPDLGSIECVERRGNLRSYEGLSKDVDKLPHYVASGSSCLMLDTGELYKYKKDTDEWYKI